LEEHLQIMFTTGIPCLRVLQYLSVFLLVVFSLVSCGYKDCSAQVDCSYDQICCGGQCVYRTGCEGNLCSDDNHCLSYETCCDGICSQYSCYTFGYGAIAGIIAASFILVCSLALCCYCACYRPRQRYRGRVTVERRATATTVISRSATQNNSPYQCQGHVPPPYQQCYPYHPPPQYVRYPPYNAGSANSSDPPPPYSKAPERRPRGVYAPQRNYGAVPTPSAQHFEQ